MQSIEKVLKGKISTSEYIRILNSFNSKHPSINEVLSYSIFFSAFALKIHDRFINTSTFLNRCLVVNRLGFGQLMRIGKELSEKKTEANENYSLLANKQEITTIRSFLLCNSDINTFKLVNSYIVRGIVHLLEIISEDEFKKIADESIKLYVDFDIPYNTLRNELYKLIHAGSFITNTKEVQQYLLYFNSATPIEEVDYLCFYKPFFLALQDYCNYLTNKNNDSLTFLEATTNFSTIEYDFRKGYSGRLSYDDIIEKKRFRYMEELLVEDGIIDTDYNFIEKKGNKKALAAIIKFMVYENYFRKSNYKQCNNFSEYHYRQYLDHRYNVDTTQQSKKITDNEVRLFLQSKRWKYDLNKLINTDFLSLNTL